MASPGVGSYHRSRGRRHGGNRSTALRRDVHVKLYDGPCANGYVRGKNETLVWGIYCHVCADYRVHEMQHPEPGPAMDWARMHIWQHSVRGTV